VVLRREIASPIDCLTMPVDSPDELSLPARLQQRKPAFRGDGLMSLNCVRTWQWLGRWPTGLGLLEAAHENAQRHPQLS
jgi:hypothetical protein